MPNIISTVRRRWRDYLRGPERRAPAPPAVAAPPPPARITESMLAAVKAALATQQRSRMESHPVTNPFVLPRYAPGVIGGDFDAKTPKLAMDDMSNLQQASAMSWAGGLHGMFAEGIGFYGYPYLAELNQRSEYRRPSEVIAEEMTRKGWKITAKGDGDKSEKIRIIEDRLDDLRVRDLFFEAMLYDGQYGQSFLFSDVGGRENDAEMMAPLLMSPAKIGRGSLKRFAIIDPMWMAPLDYNSMDPTDPMFYKPQTWFVMGRRFSATRLLQFNSRPVADILKPGYNFGGISLTQMLKPYVDNWLRARQSVSDLLNSFTIWVLETNLMSQLNPVLAGGGMSDASSLQNRLELFALLKNVRGVAAVDKNTETLTNVSAPLGTLDQLQAQAQEHMASVTGIPLVKQFGISPHGLNATADPEIRVFYDSINARQKRVCGAHLDTALKIVQLDEFGEIDPSITATWLPLWELDEAGRAAVRKIDADTAAVYTEIGVIDADEERARLANSEESLYAGLEGPAPGLPEQDIEEPHLADPAAAIGLQGAEGSERGANAGDGAADDTEALLRGSPVTRIRRARG